MRQQPKRFWKYIKYNILEDTINYSYIDKEKPKPNILTPPLFIDQFRGI